MQRTISVGRSQEEMLRLQLHTRLHQPGCDPSPLFELLEHAIEHKVWEALGLGSLRELIERPLPDGIGASVDVIRKLVEVPHRYEGDPDKHQRMERLRQDIE